MSCGGLLIFSDGLNGGSKDYTGGGPLRSWKKWRYNPDKWVTGVIALILGCPRKLVNGLEPTHKWVILGL